MAEFTLPKNSQVKKGKHFPAAAGATNVRTFKVYRWSPDDDQNPHTDTYDCLLYTSPSPRDGLLSRMPSSA